MNSSIFQITNKNIVKISALKVYLKFNWKIVLITWTLSKHGKPSWSNLEISNFKTFRAVILTLFSLIIWKIDDFINSFWLYLTFKLSPSTPSIMQTSTIPSNFQLLIVNIYFFYKIFFFRLKPKQKKNDNIADCLKKPSGNS
jgi:hypothetical protein